MRFDGNLSDRFSGEALSFLHSSNLRRDLRIREVKFRQSCTNGLSSMLRLCQPSKIFRERIEMDTDRKSLIPGLPNEVATICLAKISLSLRHLISRVCRSWQNLFKEEYFWDVRREHSACETLLLVWTGHLYLSGVWHGYYPATGVWFRLPLMPRGIKWKGASRFAVVDEKLFVIGGKRGPGDSPRAGMYSAVCYFDLKRYEWQDASPLNVGRCRCVVAVITNLLYVFGGRIDGTIDLAEACTAEVYSPATKTWTFVSSLEFPMVLVSSIAAQGKIYAATTHVKSPHSSWKGAVYSPDEDEWTEIPEALESEWNGLPVEFNGLICVNRDSSDYGESCVLGYNPSDNT